MISKVDCHAWKAIESILGMSAKMSDNDQQFYIQIVRMLLTI